MSLRVAQHNTAVSGFGGVDVGGPVRTCVGCRRKDSRSVLLRVVLRSSAGQPGGDVVPDTAARLPGRGAWVHPTSDCVELAIKRRAFGRALRASGAVDTTEVRRFVAGLPVTVASTGVAAKVQVTESGFDADEHQMSTQR